MSIIHVLLFKFDNPSDAEQCVLRLHGMVGRIPALRHLSAGINTVPSDRAYDVGLVATFASHEELLSYVDHPVHRPVAAWINGRASSVVAVDYEE